METMEEMVSDEIRKLVPVLGKDSCDRLEKSYLLGDEEVRKRIIEMVDVVKGAISSDEKLKDTVLLEPPSKELTSSGDIELGHVLYGKRKLYPLKLDKNMFMTHMGVFGSSGYGKTNLAYLLIDKLSKKNLPVIIFDFSKRNYKELLNTDLKDRVEIYTVGRNISPFKFNPLKGPQGISNSQWVKEFSSIFDHSYWLMGGGRHVTMKGLSKLFEKKEPPTMQDLKEWLSKYSETGMSSRERNWVATAQRPLMSLCFKETGNVFDCEKGVTPDTFFEKGKITVLELDALSTNDRTFLIEIILQWIRDWLLISNAKEKLRGIIIMEEAHHMLNREKSKQMGSETVMDLIFREIRELGIGVIYLDQHPSLVSYPALGNTSTHIYMNLGLDTKHASDVMDASSMLGLDYEKDGNYIRQLPVGHGFMLCRRLSFTRPFLISFPNMDIEKGVITDDDIKEHMYIKTKELYKKEKQEKKKEKQEIQIKLNEEQNDVLNVIAMGKGASTSEIYTWLNWSGSKFSEISDQLKKMGLLNCKQGKVYRQKARYYFLTSKGEGIAKNINKEESIDTEYIRKTFKVGGWSWKKEESKLIIAKGKKELQIKIEQVLNRKKVYHDIEDGIYYICSSDDVKNIVLQQAARNAYENKEQITVFVATENELRKEEANFKKVVFE